MTMNRVTICKDEAKKWPHWIEGYIYYYSTKKNYWVCIKDWADTGGFVLVSISDGQRYRVNSVSADAYTQVPKGTCLKVITR